MVLVCDIDIPYPDTWDRSGEVNRKVFHLRTLAELRARNIPFFLLKGSLETRVEQARRLLDGYEKYANPADWWNTLPSGC